MNLSIYCDSILKVGELVGCPLGSGDGPKVGTNEGLPVLSTPSGNGEAVVGMLVGAESGVFVGLDVGCDVGCNEGTLVGLAVVGAAVGTVDGCADGFVVGCPEGAAVG